jgi:hypothetical protein
MVDVRRRTEEAVAECEAALTARDAAGEGSAERREAERRAARRLSRWVREMEALGAEVKGAWLVDFDTGAGYYCWKWPEPELGHFHGYEDGFAGRVPIQ